MFPEGRALELLLAAVVALIVVGPKDLPVLLRKFGQFMAKVRSMAAEFRASFDEMARQSELDELRKEVEAMRQSTMSDIATHAPEVNQAFNDVSQGLSDVGVELNAPVSTPYASVQTEHVEIPPPKTARAKKVAAKKRVTAAAKTAAAPQTAKPSAAKLKPTAKTAASKAPAKPAAVKASTVKSSAKAPAKPATKPVATKTSAPASPRSRKASAS